MLKKKTALIVLSGVVALALFAAFASLISLGALTPSSPSLSQPDSLASAAISPASSFSKFTNGMQYFYTNASGAQTAITVSSSATWGTRTNPYVITTKEQWQLFINTIAACNPSTGDATWNVSSTYYSLGADIDFGGNVIAPVGKGSCGFYGQFLGNKHTLKNAYLDFYNSGYGNENYMCTGIFNACRPGSGYYDVIVDSTIKIDATKYTSGNTTSTTGAMGNTRHMLIGGFAAWTQSGVTFSNITSKAQITLKNTSTTQSQTGSVGGILGSVWSGATYMYNCVSQVRTEYWAAAAHTAADNNVRLGGLVGSVNDGGASLTINNCAVSGTTIIDHYDGACLGGIVGYMNAPTTQGLYISNVVVNATLSLPDATANYNTPDVGAILGGAAATGAFVASKISVSDIYITGGSPTNQLFSANNSTAITTDVAASFSNIQTSAATSTTITPSALVSKVTKNGSASAVATKANADADIAKVMTVASAGTVTSKLATNYITFVKGAGATGGPTADLAYSSTGTVQTLTVTAPARTGYTFKGWSLTGHQGTVSGTTTQIKTLANQGGNITAYAVWELNAFTGTNPSAATITYGSNGTFTAAAVTHPATTSSTTYGVNLSYQWQTSAGVNIGIFFVATQNSLRNTKNFAEAHKKTIVGRKNRRAVVLCAPLR